MQKLADAIADILEDYHAYNNFKFDAAHVLKWVSQFDENDQHFILEELLHLLNNGIYVSEALGRKLLIDAIIRLSKRFEKGDVVSFLNNSEFLNLQNEEKSQSVLLNILDEGLKAKYGFGILECGKVSKKYAVYIDDIIASGNTVYNSLASTPKGWLDIKDDGKTTNAEKIISKEKVLIVSAFCVHTSNDLDWRLKGKYGEGIFKKVVFDHYYLIENIRIFKQKLNFAYPIKDNNEAVQSFFNSINKTKDEAVAFRNEGVPKIESFFSSKENRTRFETIILHKGVEVFGRVKNLGSYHRPLGVTPPFHKTLGTGTLFFTWRNISNTTPIVFWWDNNDWYPLFELINRGK